MNCFDAACDDVMCEVFDFLDLKSKLIFGSSWQRGRLLLNEFAGQRVWKFALNSVFRRQSVDALKHVIKQLEGPLYGFSSRSIVIFLFTAHKKLVGSLGLPDHYSRWKEASDFLSSECKGVVMKTVIHERDLKSIELLMPRPYLKLSDQTTFYSRCRYDDTTHGILSTSNPVLPDGKPWDDRRNAFVGFPDGLYSPPSPKYTPSSPFYSPSSPDYHPSENETTSENPATLPFGGLEFK